MNSFVFKLLLVLAVFSIVASKRRETRGTGQACKEDEDCKRLMECDPFLLKLRNWVPGTRKLIKDHVCGRLNSRIKVCCPGPASPFSISARVKARMEDPFPSDCGVNPRAAKNIVNGEETEMGEFPWMAVLGYQEKDDPLKEVIAMCSGSVINARYVLTAAHCVDSTRLLKFNLTTVRLGEWDLSSDPDCYEANEPHGKVCAPRHIDAKPEEIISHPMFDQGLLLANDIALIRLDRKIAFETTKGYILPICLPDFGLNSKFVAQGRKPIVAGWGRTKEEGYSPVLLKAEVSFADDSLCKSTFPFGFGEKQLCIGGTKQDSCDGDSGSPLMLGDVSGPPYLQIGIVSFGRGICGDPETPAVYTSVSQHRGWIEENVMNW